jgi:chromosome segregation ATPase
MGDEERIAPDLGKRLADAQIAWPRKPWLTKPRSDAPRWLMGMVGFRIALPGLDAAIRRQSLTLNRVRRAVATVATSRKRLEMEIAQLDHQNRAGTKAGQGGTADDQLGSRSNTERLADLRRQYADLRAREERMTGASQHLQAELINFRAARKAVEAAYNAAEAAASAAWRAVG